MREDVRQVQFQQSSFLAEQLNRVPIYWCLRAHPFWCLSILAAIVTKMYVELPDFHFHPPAILALWLTGLLVSSIHRNVLLLTCKASFEISPLDLRSPLI